MAYRGEIYSDMYYDEYVSMEIVADEAFFDWLQTIRKEADYEEDVMMNYLLPCEDYSNKFVCEDCSPCRKHEPDVFDYAETVTISRKEAVETIEQAAQVIIKNLGMKGLYNDLILLEAYIEIGREWHIETDAEPESVESNDASLSDITAVYDDGIPF